MISANYLVDETGRWWDMQERMEHEKQEYNDTLHDLRIAAERAVEEADFRGEHDLAELIAEHAWRNYGSPSALDKLLYRAAWCRAWGKGWAEFPE
jgi:hypothetical protein